MTKILSQTGKILIEKPKKHLNLIKNGQHFDRKAGKTAVLKRATQVVRLASIVIPLAAACAALPSFIILFGEAALPHPSLSLWAVRFISANAVVSHAFIS